MTAHGVWSVREGILVKNDQGEAEIAPIPWLGSESLEEAITFCQAAPPYLDREWLSQIPDHLPATQFGFACLLDPLPKRECPVESALLLGTVQQAMTWDPPTNQPVTVKIKIGVAPVAEEQGILDQLLQRWPQGSRLRLDANGGLSLAASREWLGWCAEQPVEFVEQPVRDPELLWLLAAEFSTPIAIDESLGRDLTLWRDWPGVLVIKPSLWGSPYTLIRVCQALRPDAVISSALETPVGYGHVLRVGEQLRPWLRRERLWGLGGAAWR